MDWHTLHRPITFRRCVGNKAVISQLVSYVKNKTIPQCMLFTGPSGCGKTTFARILASKLDAHPSDIRESNASQDTSINNIREIQDRVGLAAHRTSRIWIIDECHQLSLGGLFFHLLGPAPLIELLVRRSNN